MLCLWDILITLVIFELHFHNVEIAEKTFRDKHSQNVLMILFVLDEHLRNIL